LSCSTHEAAKLIVFDLAYFGDEIGIGRKHEAFQSVRLQAKARQMCWPSAIRKQFEYGVTTLRGCNSAPRHVGFKFAIAALAVFFRFAAFV
jgi:hypothetical protein